MEPPSSPSSKATATGRVATMAWLSKLTAETGILGLGYLMDLPKDSLQAALINVDKGRTHLSEFENHLNFKQEHQSTFEPWALYHQSVYRIINHNQAKWA